MGFLFYAVLLVIFLASCTATMVACEAYRLGDVGQFRIAVSCAVPLGAVTLAMAIAGGAMGFYNLKPRTDHVGFGPEWHCVGSSAKGGGFCIRDTSQHQPD